MQAWSQVRERLEECQIASFEHPFRGLGDIHSDRYTQPNVRRIRALDLLRLQELQLELTKADYDLLLIRKQFGK